MRIMEIQERTVLIASQIRNAYIDFGKMTVSVVALTTDAVRNGRPIVGYGFNSNGRYAQGCLLRERFIPRTVEAEPKSLVTDLGGKLAPFRVFEVMMQNEKPGGHGERSVAAGVIDMNESYPDVLAPFGGLADSTSVEDGVVGLPHLPGIGFEDKRELVDLFRSLF